MRCRGNFGSIARICFFGIREVSGFEDEARPERGSGGMVPVNTPGDLKDSRITFSRIKKMFGLFPNAWKSSI